MNQSHARDVYYPTNAYFIDPVLEYNGFGLISELFPNEEQNIPWSASSLYQDKNNSTLLVRWWLPCSVNCECEYWQCCMLHTVVLEQTMPMYLLLSITLYKIPIIHKICIYWIWSLLYFPVYVLFCWIIAHFTFYFDFFVFFIRYTVFITITLLSVFASFWHRNCLRGLWILKIITEAMVFSALEYRPKVNLIHSKFVSAVGITKKAAVCIPFSPEIDQNKSVVQLEGTVYG